MEKMGTLKKRRRRILTKVDDQSIIPYQEKDLVFKITKRKERRSSSLKKEYTVVHPSRSQINDVQKASNKILSSRTRPTRNAIFHRNQVNVFDIEDGQTQTEESSNNCAAGYPWKQNAKTETNDRPYLLSSHTLSRLRQILFLGLTSGTFLWKWDKNEQRIHKFSQKYQKIYQFFRVLFVLQTLCIILYQIYILWQVASSGTLTNREIFMTSFSLMWYWEWMDYTVNMFIYGDQIREYINTLLKFNQEMVNKYVIYLGGYKEDGQKLLNFTTLGGFWAVFIKIVYFLRMPFAPWYLFSYIFPKPWYWLMPGAIQAFLFSGQVVASHTLVCWLVAAHTNTVQFWLREIHNNNDSGYTSDKLRKRQTSIDVFKSLQVLNNYFNDCVCRLYIPAIKAHTAVVAIVSGYVMIRSMNYLFIDEFPQSLIYPMGFFICTIEAFVVLNMSSKMYDLTISFLNSWSLTTDKDFRKVLIGCSSLKIRVRSFYFITVSTLITFFQTLWDKITNILVNFI